VRTDSADADGAVIETRPTDGVTEAALREQLPRFTGSIEQLPPMYSAVKHQGERLYKLARQGKEVERTPRTVQIFALDLLSFTPPTLELDVHCSKGTYVRALAEDIGEALGCGAHVSALRRTGVGPYVEGDTRFVSVEDVEAAAEQGTEALDAMLLPLDSALGHFPAVKLSADAAFYLGQGQPVLVPQAPTDGMVRLYAGSSEFLGVGLILDDGRVQPKRLI
jgi:tRNA pseudouridine55 synthase